MYVVLGVGYLGSMALFWDFIAPPCVYFQSLRAGRAHLPVFPCACATWKSREVCHMEGLRQWGKQQFFGNKSATKWLAEETGRVGRSKQIK